MDLGLDDKVALVLGAGSGLGAAIARELAAEGARVVVANRSAPAAERTAHAIDPDGARVMTAVWDLAALDEIDDRIQAVENRFGPVEILVNNTGGPPPTPVADQPLAVWRDHFEAMVLAVIAVTDRVLPAMRRQQWGRIITSTSSGVVAPIPNLGLSNALRAGLVGWSKTLAGEVARDNVTCNVVIPGRIATDRIHSLDALKAQRQGRPVAEVSAESIAAIPAGRYGDPREYAQTVAFLAGAAASYITGSTVRVDGGMIAGS